MTSKNIMNLKELFSKFCITLIHLWLKVERLIIVLFLKKSIERKVRDIYLLDEDNKQIIEVLDSQFYIHAANKSLLGFCESYMNGWVSMENIHDAVINFMRAGKYLNDPGFKYKAFLDYLEFELFHVSSSEKSIKVADTHYNLGNDLFEAMLGETMNYSCALWKSPNDTLASAQRNKMEILAKKMKLKPGMRVLDIGCGWGGMAKYLAQEHGVSVVATTTSIEGAKYATEFCQGLPVKVIISDCRDLISKNEKFDRILAIEVLVHVGRKNYDGFFNNVNQCLKDDGIFMLHAIGSNNPALPSVNNLHNTMIPDSRIPYIKDIIEATEGLFVVEDWSNIGVNYDKTAMAWNTNFQKVRSEYVSKKGEKFCRMWEFFLQTNAAVGKTRSSQIWHIVFSKSGLENGYTF